MERVAGEWAVEWAPEEGGAASAAAAASAAERASADRRHTKTSSWGSGQSAVGVVRLTLRTAGQFGTGLLQFKLHHSSVAKGEMERQLCGWETAWSERTRHTAVGANRTRIWS